MHKNKTLIEIFTELGLLDGEPNILQEIDLTPLPITAAGFIHLPQPHTSKE